MTMIRSAIAALACAIAGRTLATAAAGALAIALPWTVLATTGDARYAGLAALVLQGPAVVFGLLTTRLVGRWRPRAAILASNLGCGLLLALAAAAYGEDAAAIGLVLAGLALGIAMPGTTVHAARAPELARRARWSLERFNGVAEGLAVIALFGGGAAAAATLTAFDVWVVVGAGAALLGLVLLLDLVAFPDLRAVTHPGAQSLRVAAAAIWADRPLLVTVLACLAMVAVYQSMDDVTVPKLLLLAGAGPDQLVPFVLGSCGGVLAGGLWVAARGGRHRTMAFGGLCIAVGVAALSLLPVAALVCAGLLLGFGAGLLSPIATTLVQRRTLPAQRLGVLALLSVGMDAFGPVGSAAAGVWIEASSLADTVLLLSATALAAALAIMRFGAAAGSDGSPRPPRPS